MIYIIKLANIFNYLQLVYLELPIASMSKSVKLQIEAI